MIPLFWEETPKWMLVLAGIIIFIIFAIFIGLWGMFVIPLAINIVVITKTLVWIAIRIFAKQHRESILIFWQKLLWWWMTILIIVGFYIAVMSELFWWWVPVSIGLIIFELGILLYSKFLERHS